MGVYIGDCLVPVDPQSGQAPLFEDSRVLKIHDSILEVFDSSWQDIQQLPDEWWQSAIVADLKQQLLDLICGEFVDQPIWAIKDPRLSLLAPLWLDICRQLNSDPKFIIMYRHPDEVAQSLLKRDDLMPEKSQLLWLYYSLFAEYNTRGYSRTFFAFEKLLRQDFCPLHALESTLDIQFPERSRLNQFFDPALKHYSEDRVPQSHWIAEVFDQFVLADEHPQQLQQARMDQLRVQFIAATKLFSPVQRQQQLHIEEIDRGFIQADGTVDEQKSQLRHLGDGFKQAAETIEVQKSQFEKQQAGFDQAVAMLKEREKDLQIAIEQRIQLEQAQQLSINQINTLQQNLKDAERQVREALDRCKLLEDEDNDLDKSHEAGAIDSQMPVTDVAIPNLDVAGKEEPRYQSEIDLRVINNAHSKIYRCIEEASLGQSKRVLDVGCSTGYLGYELKNSGHDVWGVDLSSAATAVATEKLDHVYTGSIEAFFSAPEHQDLKFDFIIFGDVLEHLVDPGGILERCKAFLSDNGSIIASLPNVAHLAVRLMLLEGRWEYQNTGILDRTHLKFFTRDSIVSTFSDCGYEIVSLDPVRLALEEMDIGVNEPLLSKVAPQLTDDEQDVFQYVIHVRRDAESEDLQIANSKFMLKRSHKILCLLPAPESTLVDIRLKAPLNKLTQLFGGEFRINSIHEIDQDDLNWSEAVVLQREANPHVLDVIAQLAKLKKKVIFEIDDLLTDVPEYLTVHEHCVKMRPHLEEALRMADAVTVSTGLLKEQLAVHNENIFVVPNCASTAFPPINHYDVEADPAARVPQATLLIASSDTVRVDFIMLTLKRLLDEKDLAIKLVGIGPPGKFLKEKGFDIEVHPMMEYDHFKAFLAGQENAIGLIPLDDSVFNRCKSAIKYLDYGVAGIPSVCSNIPPYSDVITHGKNGFLCPEDAGAWFEAIKQLSTSALLRKKIARAALAHCQKEHGMYRSAAAWQNVLDRCNVRPVRVLVNTDLPFLHSTRPFLEHLFRPKSYLYALRILKLHGLRGIVNRIRSLV